MNIIEDSNIVNIKFLNTIDVVLPNVFTGLKNNIIMIDNKLYYCKKVSNSELLNELIGSYISQMIELDSVDYKIGKINNDYYVLSELFFEDGYKYYYPYQKGYNLVYDYETLNDYDKVVYYEDVIPKNNIIITNKILKLILLDLKMGQTDRCNSTNLLIKEKKDGRDCDLCPIYDFGNSYLDLPSYPNFNIYSNSFVIIKKNIESFKILLKNYPQIDKIIDVLNNISMESIFNDIEIKYNIKISNHKRTEYEYYDKEYSKLLKMI